MFYHCSPLKMATPLTILKALVWSIFGQRPDLALAAGTDDKYWAARIRDANNRVPALWDLLAKLCRRVRTVWLVLDSVHDCSGGDARVAETLYARFPALNHGSQDRGRVQIAGALRQRQGRGRGGGARKAIVSSSMGSPRHFSPNSRLWSGRLLSGLSKSKAV